MSRLLLELDRAEIAESGVQATTIVPNLNVFKYCGSRQSMSSKLGGHTFSFQGTKETFGNCIVITIPNTTHTHLDLRIPQTALVNSTGVLAALIRMMQKRFCGVASL